MTTDSTFPKNRNRKSADAKRAFDVLFAIVLLIPAVPMMGIVGLAVWLEDRKGPLYRQERVGAGNSRFILTKFRSMPKGTPTVASVDAAELAVTRVGQVIRRLSLDELPQLFNVVSGDMSVVGPRPALASQIDVLSLREKGGASSVRPGLTGWAQVNSFDGMPVEEKARFDNEYADRMSLAFDARILLRTVGYLLKKPPAY